MGITMGSTANKFLIIIVILSFTRNSTLGAQSIGIGIKYFGDNDREGRTISTEQSELPAGRPPVENRTFSSPIVEQVLDEVSLKIGDDTIRQIFINCLPNTLDTTILWHRPANGGTASIPYTYIITGDIEVMWIRDSTFQVEAYVPLAKDDPTLAELILGLINTQAEMLFNYPWANAFHPLKHWNSGVPFEPNPWAENDTVYPPYDVENVFEAKYELDSLACFLHLSNIFWKETGITDFLDNPFWEGAVREVLKTMQIMQGSTLEYLGSEPYNFSRPTTTTSETQNLYGRGNPVRRCGLVRSFFRPSDDSTIFQYLIPSNAMAVVGLRGVANLLLANGRHPDLVIQLFNLAGSIDSAIQKWGIIQHPEFGQVYAFEVDCYGSHSLMDDAGVPSLLSLPYLGYLERADPIYLNTRKYILSPDWNPYYTVGNFPAIGSPHAGLQNSWPMSLTMQGITSLDETEILKMLWTLRNTTGGTGFMHETFYVNDPTKFTRAWFAWANTLFGTFILHLDKNFPHLLL